MSKCILDAIQHQFSRKQELSEDNEVRREATKLNKAKFSECHSKFKSRSLGQKVWYGVKGLVTKNTHVKYESPRYLSRFTSYDQG